MLRRPLVPARKHAVASHSLTQLRFQATTGMSPQISLQLKPAPQNTSIIGQGQTHFQQSYLKATEEGSVLRAASMFEGTEAWSVLEQPEWNWECTTSGSKMGDYATAESHLSNQQ